MMMPDPASVALTALAFLAGGTLKGATGAGTPIIAVPLMTMMFGVETAVAVFALPNLLANVGQSWAYRTVPVDRRLLWGFALGGGVGTAIGTALLFSLPDAVLKIAVGLTVMVYVLFRLIRPGRALSRNAAARLAPVAGGLGGVLMGATGISAPVSLTFLNAVALPRPAFVRTVSSFFVALACVQIPLLLWNGVLTAPHALLGLGAFVTIVAGMPIGARLGRRLSSAAFDRVILTLLTVLALKLLWDAL